MLNQGEKQIIVFYPRFFDIFYFYVGMQPVLIAD